MSSKKNSKTIFIADFARPCNISISCFNVNGILAMMKWWYWGSRCGGDWSWRQIEVTEYETKLNDVLNLLSWQGLFLSRWKYLSTFTPLTFLFSGTNQETTIRLVLIILRLAHKVVIMKRDCKNISVIEIPAIWLTIPVNWIILTDLVPVLLSNSSPNL